MKCLHYRAWQQELASEHVHLNLSPLPPTIIYDPVNPYRRRLSSPRWINLLDRHIAWVIAKFSMANFVGYEESLLERCTYILVEDQAAS